MASTVDTSPGSVGDGAMGGGPGAGSVAVGAPLVRRGRVASRTVLIVASFGALLAFLDATIVNVAFPSIRESFPDASIGTISWVLNAYNIVLAAFMVVCGRLSDLLGRRRLYVSGIALFTAASAWCALATSVDVLIIARLVQALGAAMLIPASLALVIEAFPGEHRAHAIGLWGAAAAVAAGLGPPIGGALVEAGGWRWAFLVNLPLGAVALVLSKRMLVESRAPGRRTMPDLMGALLFAGALGLFTTAVIKGNDWGPGNPRLWAVVVGCLVLTGGFVVSSRRHPSPLIDVELWRSRPFLMSNVVTLVAGAGFFAYLLTNILWLQYVWGYSVLSAGMALVPGALTAAVVAGALGPVAARRGYRGVIVLGALVWVAAFVWYVRAVGTEPEFLREWLPGQVLSGIGVGATLPLLGSLALEVVPGGRSATASAIVSSVRQVGGVIGIALLVVILGTPTPLNAVEVLRNGWTFSIVCFVLCAVAALFLGGVRAPESAPSPAEVMAGAGAGSSGRDDEATALAESDAAVTAARGSLFSQLPEETRARIEASARPATFPAGSWIVREGDVAETLFVLTAGRAEVLVGEQSVRELGPGAVIGELALLTGGRRSASVRARRDCTLLEVDRDLLGETVWTDQRALTALVTALAHQLAEARPPVTEVMRPGVVAVVAATAGAPVDDVAEALRAALARHLRVAVLRGTGDGQLDRVERDHDRVLLVATDHGTEWASACRRQADVVVLVANSGEPVTVEPTERAGPDVVLVGRPPTDAELAAWSAFEPWHVTVAARDDLHAGLARLGARLAGRSLGLVLSGGGARSLSHVGVLLELEEAGLHVDRLAGASFGAIIAGGYALGLGASDLEAVVYEEMVRRKPFSDYTVPRVALARGKRTDEALDRIFGSQQIELLPRQFRCVSVDLLTRSQVVFRNGSLRDAVRASSRLPGLFPPIPTADQLLVDGGVLDNTPVDVLTERDEGPLVVVNVTMGARPHRPVSPGADGTQPARPPRAIRIPMLGETLLRTMMIGSSDYSAAAGSGIHVIAPPSKGVGLLEFHQLDQMIESGRESARELLDRTGGDLHGASRV
ncbi:DHA2 family efflux MFS transporter permease subunit [Knoellia locipacati]|uniref:MDR family MFS transporter/patatin-like phospholipase family protein n=1 Tax=Knoellia locipacati TaxID=882824 RepID=UPI00384F820D